MQHSLVTHYARSAQQQNKPLTNLNMQARRHTERMQTRRATRLLVYTRSVLSNPQRLVPELSRLLTAMPLCATLLTAMFNQAYGVTRMSVSVKVTRRFQLLDGNAEVRQHGSGSASQQ